MNYNNGREKMFPWQIHLWQQLLSAKQKQHLPHAILISSSSPGYGKTVLAHTFSHALLCLHTTVEGYACGECHICHLMQASSHPDFIVIAPIKGQMIKVDQIRELVHFFNETTMHGGYRVVIIESAHMMNHHAANALLKTLEEPTPKTLFILLSSQCQRIQATITSRCQKLVCRKPASPIALEWLQSQLPPSHDFTKENQWIALQLADNAPLKALSILTEGVMIYRQAFLEGLITLSQGLTDPLQLAAEWYQWDLKMVFHLLFYWMHDLLKLQAVAMTSIVNIDYKKELVGLSHRLNNKKVLSYLTFVQNRYMKITHPFNLNTQLLMEELLIQWVKVSIK